MNSHVKCEQFDVKHEDNPLSVAEINTESQDIKFEVKTEPQDYQECCDNEQEDTDINHEVLSEPLFVSTMKIESEVEGTENLLDVDSQDYANKRETEEDEINKADEIINMDSVKKCDTFVYDIGEKSDSFQNSTFERIENITNEHVDASEEFLRFDDNRPCISNFPKRKRTASTAHKSFRCDTCNKHFSKKSNLNVHILYVHTGQEPVTCNICGKSFCGKYTLNRHMLVHTGREYYSCNWCTKVFAYKLSLNMHITHKHTGERPFTCEVCGKSFCRKSNLNRHVHIHTGGKLFTCYICNKTFSNKWNVNSHILHVHKTTAL